ncbi:ATP-binding cassette domain-containing protein [Arcanobacterium haemolyticum]|nr:ATP-binding cassette domain-containing protein [Arcanobacterium haemolyticum]
MIGLRCDDVSFSYGSHQALSSLSLSCSQGATVIVGENGAGKSTLMKLLATLERPRKGEISYNEITYAPNTINTLRKRIGYLSQFPDFPGNFSVREALNYQLWLHKVPRSERKNYIDEAVELTQAAELLTKRIRELSGGMQRRAFIAQAIVHRPDLILLDEPASGLDPHQQDMLDTVLLGLARERVLLVATHSIDQLASLAGQLVVLTRGGIAHSAHYEHGSLTTEDVKSIMHESMWS